MKYPFFLFSLFFACFSFSGHAQTKYPQNYFRSPIDFRILLSGTFGELRSDHFHTGMDIKTRGVEGATVRAAADGYVSRVKVSPYGYGKTIYITHPNGFVSVYGHLSKFEQPIAAYVKTKQYAQKSYAVDLYLKKNQIAVKKGQQIALSGNSGGSAGPHLHFEIRDEHTQEPLNPLLFGFAVKDYIRPTIRQVRVYPVGKKAFSLDLGGWGKNYYLKTGDTLAVPPEFYLAIESVDKQNDTHNNNGVFQVDLFLDSVKIFGNRQERLSFSTGRDINDFIDYAYFVQHKKRFQRAYIGKYNRLKIYTSQGNGLITLKDSKVHEVLYRVKDVPGNTSELRFHVVAENPDMFAGVEPDTLVKTVFYPNRENVFKTTAVELHIPQGALYDSLLFHFEEQPVLKTSYTPVFKIHDPTVPLRQYVELKIKADSLAPGLNSKALIARVDGEKVNTYATTWEGKWARAKVRDFGDYTIVVDTVKPQIKQLGKLKGETLGAGSKISFRIFDDLSGIKTYSAYLNGQWVLFEYDAKNDRIDYFVEKLHLKKENALRIVVEDNAGNKSILERKFSRP